MSHPKAVLTPIGRLTLVERIAHGRPAAHVAGEMGVSRATAYKWWHRYVQEGAAGLLDRSSRPLRSPRRTSARVERQIEALRRRTKLGPIRIGIRLHMPASTVHRVLVRQQLNRLSWMDRPTGRVIRRYEDAHPGDLVHVMSRNWAESHLAAAGVFTDALAMTPPGSATTTSTPPSMTTHELRTQRSAATNVAPLRQRSGLAPSPSSPPTASWCSVSSPTTLGPTGSRSPFALRSERAAPCSASSSLTGPRPMARSSASTGPCSRSGLTFAPTPQTSNGPRP